jgi:AraC family transcriptional regulator of adaptative response/methylated-DNA-[protein]-cysteine methyltransferase
MNAEETGNGAPAKRGRAAEERTMWRHVKARDPRADGRFFFAVVTTGVFCRPSCPARRPLCRNVRFFRSREDAERAGFRPCRRCRPLDANFENPQMALVQRACAHIEQQEGERVTLAALAAACGVRPFRLQRLFTRVMGISPRQYADAIRIRRFKAAVRDGEGVTSALYTAGFGSSSRLYERAPAHLGMTPREYARGGEGRAIQFAVARCPLGLMLVAATERGICAVRLGSSRSALERGFRREFPAAKLNGAAPRLRGWVRAILRHIEKGRQSPALPLDVQATAFEWRVWQALRRIPFGQTRAYSEVARAIGRPSAMRAVARACASNPVAIVVPCHRVVKSDRSLGGYRWGVERKRALLESERRALAAAARR